MHCHVTLAPHAASSLQLCTRTAYSYAPVQPTTMHPYSLQLCTCTAYTYTSQSLQSTGMCHTTDGCDLPHLRVHELHCAAVGGAEASQHIAPAALPQPRNAVLEELHHLRGESRRDRGDEMALAINDPRPGTNPPACLPICTKQTACYAAEVMPDPELQLASQFPHLPICIQQTACFGAKVMSLPQLQLTLIQQGRGRWD